MTQYYKNSEKKPLQQPVIREGKHVDITLFVMYNLLLYRLHFEQAQQAAYRQQRECCMARHMQACLVLKQFEYILNVTEHVNENYLRVKEKVSKGYRLCREHKCG